MSFALKTALPLTVLLCASITALHAYEQNGYVIFELVDKLSSKNTQTSLLQIESKIFKSTDKGSMADAGIKLENSEFLMDMTPTKPKSTTFSDATVVPDKTDIEAPETTSSFGTPSTSSFGTPSTSVFGEPKKSVFGE